MIQPASFASLVAVVLVLLAIGALASILLLLWPINPKLDDLHRKIDEGKAATDEGMRQQLDVYQQTVEQELKGIRGTVNKIWVRIERFFK